MLKIAKTGVAALPYQRDYKIISQRDNSKLEKDVRESLADGWELVGGVSMIHMYNDVVGEYYNYAQAMTRLVLNEPGSEQ